MRKVLGEDPNNYKRRDFKFCMAMDPKWGWVSTIDILGINGEEANVWLILNATQLGATFVTTCFIYWEIVKHCSLGKVHQFT
jgi:hypothetical protein